MKIVMVNQSFVTEEYIFDIDLFLQAACSPILLSSGTMLATRLLSLKKRKRENVDSLSPW